MSELAKALQLWEREFRSNAKADKLAALRDHLRWFDVRAEPEQLLEGTIPVVQACAVYMKLDGNSYAPFLAMQTYDPVRSPSAVYAFTFSLYGKAFARIRVASDLRGLDLADLYGHPWQAYKICGFDHFWVTRTDRKALTKREFVKLERQVTDDLRYDYTEDELDFWFDDSHPAGALFVCVQDRESEV